MKVKVIKAYCRGGPSGDVYEGEIIDMPEAEAKIKIAQGKVVAVNPGEVPADKGRVHFPGRPAKEKSDE